MAITNYTELKTAVADWLNRDDLTTRIPDFIALAEASFNRSIRTRDMISRSVATTTNEYVPLPPDWLETYQLELPASTTSGYSQPLTYIGLQEAAIHKASVMTGNPRYYTVIDGQFELVPAPTSSVTLTCTYFARIPALSAIQSANWLLTKAPDLYLYASLSQAAPYLNNDERIPTWMQLAQKAQDEVIMDSERSTRPRVGFSRQRRTF